MKRKLKGKKLKPKMKLKQKVFFSGEEKLGEETRRLIEESEERREKEERNTVFRVFVSFRFLRFLFLPQFILVTTQKKNSVRSFDCPFVREEEEKGRYEFVVLCCLLFHPSVHTCVRHSRPPPPSSPTLGVR